MKYYIYLENGKLNGCGIGMQLTEGVENLEVTEGVFNSYLEVPEKFVYSAEPIEGIEAVIGNIYQNPNYEAELAEIQKEKRTQEILQELEELDKKRIRALCESEVKDEENGETWLEYYNSQILTLREELQSL